MGEPGEIPQEINQLSIPDKLNIVDSKSKAIVDKIAVRAYGFCWEKGISSNEIVFPKENGKVAIGIETVVPVRFVDVKDTFGELMKQYAEEKKVDISDNEIQKKIDANIDRGIYLGILDELPKNIKRIRILDMASEESLPRKQRSIEQHILITSPLTKNVNQKSSEHSMIDKLLIDLEMPASLSSTKKRSEVLESIINETFGFDKESVEKFKKMLEKSTAEEILIIHAHGGYDNIIGEKDREFKGSKNEWADPNIDLEELIEKYDDPKRISAILVHTCYKGNENPPVRRIPVYRLYGFARSEENPFVINKPKTLVSEPNT